MNKEEAIEAIDEAQSYLPNHAVEQWDELEKVKQYIKSIRDNKDKL